ncbi:hypothetical protein [Prosthecobacter sp.]|uniref:hypothetical protein n=1 Tax=Prosthecobacter sp. TaxID=1965333 RepID=UPI0025FC8899|nr:hypothetical protein [Prosthecobacter sp.]
MKKRFSTGADHSHQFLLFRIEAHLDEQTRGANDAIHRRANLMAHVGKEASLGRSGGLGLAFGGLVLNQKRMLAVIFLLNVGDHGVKFILNEIQIIETIRGNPNIQVA